MSDPILDVTDTPDPADEAEIRARLAAFNRALVGSALQRKPFGVFLRDDAGAVIGGIIGYSQSTWLYIDNFVLPDGARGRGLGRKILARAEAVGRERGCTNVYLTTLSWQAKPFYVKQGYREFARLDDFPPGHARHYMTKEL